MNGLAVLESIEQDVLSATRAHAAVAVVNNLRFMNFTVILWL
jgi:hypothetical protein